MKVVGRGQDSNLQNISGCKNVVGCKLCFGEEEEEAHVCRLVHEIHVSVLSATRVPLTVAPSAQHVVKTTEH